MINKVTLIGHLGANPEIRTLESGAMVARFTLATSESYKDKNNNWQKNTEWHRIVLWRQLAERSSNQLQKGDLVLVEGKISYREWKDAEGNNRNTTEILANSFRRLARKEENAQGNSQYNNNYNNSSSSGDSNNTPEKVIAVNTDDDAPNDLPF